MSNALVAVQDMQVMARAIAASGLFGMKTPDQALALMLIAQAEGKHPASAAQEYHIIQGRPALKADAMLARFQAAGGKVDWKSYTDSRVSAVFSHPSGGSVEICWTMEMAKKITFDKWVGNNKTEVPLTEKDNWKNYPRQMLRARVISEGVRTVYPGIAIGMYTPEEVQDFDNKGKTQDADFTVMPDEAANAQQPPPQDAPQKPQEAAQEAPGATNEPPAAHGVTGEILDVTKALALPSLVNACVAGTVVSANTLKTKEKKDEKGNIVPGVDYTVYTIKDATQSMDVDMWGTRRTACADGADVLFNTVKSRKIGRGTFYHAETVEAVQA